MPPLKRWEHGAIAAGRRLRKNPATPVGVTMKTALALVIGLCLPLLTAGCTHLAGQVLWAQGDTPVPTAEFTVGPPGSPLSTNHHHVNADGRFNFWISPLDTSDLWVWSGLGDPTLNAMHIDARTVGDHMRVILPAPMPTAPLTK
jgi:hypothetical protein